MANRQSYLHSVKGFTLIEVIVAITIMGIASAIAYPFFTSYLDKYSFRDASRDVLTTVMLARSNAARDGANWQIDLDTAGNSFNLVSPTGAMTNHDLSTYSNGVRLISNGENCGNATKDKDNVAIIQPANIQFDQRGFGASPGSIYLENANNDICFAVRVTAGGAVKILRYSGATPFDVTSWN